MREFEKEWRLLKPKEICVDPLYQRNLDEKRVAKMVKEYNPNLVNPPKISFRDGKYWVFDGQHTIAMLRKVRGEKPIECRVFHGMTWIDELELFIAQNGIDSDPTTMDKLRASYNGGDPEVKAMVHAAQLAGVTVDFQRGKIAGRVVAVSTLFKMFKTMEQHEFIAVLQLIMDAWPFDPDGLSNQIISGLSRFYTTYKDRIKKNDLLKVIKSYTPRQIIAEGRGVGGSKEVTYARIFLRMYNKNRTKNRLEDII